MNRAQKIAWSLVITISAGVVTGCVAFGVLYFKVGMPKALAGFAFIGIAGLGGFSPLIFGKDKGEVTFDERDKLIKRRAALAGFATSYLFVGLACMIPFSILGPKGVIPVKILPAMVIGGLIITTLVQSIVILEEYGWRDKSHE